MPKFSIRITLDETVLTEADDEEEAEDNAWDDILTQGSYSVDIQEIEDD